MEANRHDHSVPPHKQRKIIAALVGAIILAIAGGRPSFNAFRGEATRSPPQAGE